MHQRLTTISILTALACIAVALTAYWPGLHGGFLFDDFANLPALGSSGPVDNWATFLRYITSGTADPTGRPLTLLTFLLDAHDWPADPFPFKRTNLILHLLNGVLLYALLAHLGNLLNIAKRQRITAALLGAALWLLHPLLVSTTLYIVQREAMLPATCVLIGLLLWLHGRAQLVNGRTTSGIVWTCVGLVGFTALAVLAKANGALLPLFALLLEYIVLAPRWRMPNPVTERVHRRLLFVLAVIPSMALVAYVIWMGLRGVITGDMGIRPWTIGQRLLTEPRVLLDYLSLLWLPRPFSGGLFNDQYLASTSLWHPATTLPALLAIVLLMVGAWWWRRRQPALALAVLFYFAGQLIESTSLPLELYFEHRNYLPAMLMFWPLGLWLADSGKLTMLKRALMIVLPLGLAVMTFTRAQLWGNERTQALVWAQINPQSGRAQANAAQLEIAAGQPLAAIRRLQPLLAAQPDQVQLAFNLIAARCLSGGVGPADIAAARQAMHTTSNPGVLLTSWFNRTLPTVAAGGCRGLTLVEMSELVSAGLHNPKLGTAGPQQDLTYLRGRIALAQQQPDAALADFSQALDLQVRPDMALQSAATLGAAGYPAQGLRLLDHYQQVQGNGTPPEFGMPMLHAWVLARQNYWPHELAHLRHELSLDVASNSTNTARSAPDSGTAR
ncbi:MAG: tetratricopeptide repeat protein [Rhodanobacter sp.]